MFQAIIEFNWFALQHLLTFEERMTYFEGFWESQAARVGEPNACGWAQWQYLYSRNEEVDAASPKPYPAGNTANSKHFLWSTKGTHLIPKKLPQGNNNRWVRPWLEKEEQTSMEQWY